MAMGRDLPVRRSAPRWTGSHSRDAPPSWRYGRDRSRLVVLAAERCRRLEARPTDHRLCLLHQLRDRVAVRVARGSHPRGSPGRVWGHLRGDRATTRRRGRRPRAAPPAARGPRTARPLLGRSPCGGCGPCTSRSRDHTKEGSSATRLGRSAWPSGHSVAAATVSQAGRRMTRSGSQPSDSQGSISIRIAGGHTAPTRARRWVGSQLEGQIPAATASDAALLVSELVTNSVVHANVGARRSLSVELTTLDDRVRIAVTDPGSHLRPCMLPSDPETPGGLGLLVVDELCETWGAWQDLGFTRVWCELLLDQSQPSGVTTPLANAPTLSAVQARGARPA